MRVLLIDQEMQFLDMALRCADSGHEVRLFQDSRDSRDGEGFRGITKITDWRSSMPWSRDGLIITSGNCKFTRELDRFRDIGFRIFGPTWASSQLEIDRALCMEEAKKCGIPVPHYEAFNSLEEASSFARKAEQPYVFKPMGSEDDKSLTFVSCDPAEMVGWIERKIKKGVKLKGPCMLQEKIDMLCEIGIAGWFGPKGFLKDKYEISFEHKKLMNGEIGCNTGEMGTLCQYVENDPLVTDALLPFENFLFKSGHMGDFAVGLGVDNKGKCWIFETTCRLGWPDYFIRMAMHTNRDPAKWMRDLLDGEDTLKVSRETYIGVVMAQPMFPYGKSKPEDVEGNPITGIEDNDNVHPIGVMIGKGPVMEGGKVVNGRIPMTTGEYVCCVTGSGEGVAAAIEDVYDNVSGVKFADAIYRTDIGEKVGKVLSQLHEFGYALEIDS